MTPATVHHVFPYDPAHLGLSVDAWWASQLQRWPLAAVSETHEADRTNVHVIGPHRQTLISRLTLHVHPGLFTGPRYRRWGDDWSHSLGRALRDLGPADLCYVHLNDYASARLCLRAASKARTVTVFHGLGVGHWDPPTQAADKLIFLREEAVTQFLEEGAADYRLELVTPSVDRRLLYRSGRDLTETPKIGFVGRLEPSKGIAELAAAMRQLSLKSFDVRLDIIGTDTSESSQLFSKMKDRVRLYGEQPSTAVAAMLKSWDVLAVPSYTEGCPLVVLEALAAGVHVVAIESVLPRRLEQLPLVIAGPRDAFADNLVHALQIARGTGRWSAPSVDVVPGHQEGAAVWDRLAASTHRVDRRPRPSIRPYVGRWRRLVARASRWQFPPNVLHQG